MFVDKCKVRYVGKTPMPEPARSVLRPNARALPKSKENRRMQLLPSTNHFRIEKQGRLTSKRCATICYKHHSR